MKRVLPLVSILTCLLIFGVFLALPSKTEAAIQTINFKFCPTIDAGQLDNYILSNGKLAIYKGTPTSTSKPMVTIDMQGPDLSGVALSNPCYSGFEGTGDVDTKIKPLTLLLEIPVFPPGSQVGDVPTQYLAVTTNVPVLAVSSGDTFKFGGTLSNAGIKPIDNSSKLFVGNSLGGYRLFPSLSCQTSNQPLTCFTQAVFQFAQIAIIVLAVGAMVIAGIIYMTSAGNPKQIEMAKKLIIGALTGVAVMILGRLFLTQVVGVSWPWL